MSVSFTPGPWGANCSHIYAPDGAIIATVSNPGSKERDYPLVANRDLMAAAPDYHAATEILLAADLPEDEQWREGLQMLFAAHRKARGQS